MGIDYCNIFSRSYWYWYWQYFFGLVLVLNIAILFTSIVNNPVEVYKMRNCELDNVQSVK